MIVACGTFATGTGTGDLAAQTPDLGGATPQAIMMFHTSRGGGSGDVVWSVGACTGTTERTASGVWIDDGATTTDTAHIQASAHCLAVVTAASTQEGAVDVTALSADSFTPTIDDAFNEDKTVAWFAIADITDAEAGTFQLTTGADQTVGTSDWDCVIFFGYAATALDTIAAQARPVIGFATATKSRCFNAVDQDNAADTNTFSLISDDFCWANMTTGGVVGNSIKVNSLTGGIALTRVAGTGTPFVGYLALKGVSADIIDSAHVVGTGNATVTGASFTPKFVMSLLSPAAEASDEATARDGMEGGVGYADGTAHYANWIGEADALATSDPMAAQVTNRMSINRAIGNSATDEGDMALASFESGGCTLDQDTAAAAAYWMPLLLLGDEATASVNQTSSSLRRTTRRRR